MKACNFPGTARLLAEVAGIYWSVILDHRLAGKHKGSLMGAKLKVAGWLAVGAITGALATMQLQFFQREL